MKINTQAVLKNMDGTPMKYNGKDYTFGMAIGDLLGAAVEGGKMKMFTLGSKFYTETEFDIDESDLALVKKTIETSKLYGAGISGQVLLMLEAVK